MCFLSKLSMPLGPDFPTLSVPDIQYFIGVN